MTTSYSADRINVFHLMQLHPDWTQQQFAQAVGRSKSWVYQWHKRLGPGAATDEQTLHHIAQGQSRARTHPPHRLDPRVEALVLAIRDSPPERLGRTPGPKAILSSLP